MTFAEWEARHLAANPPPVVIDRPAFMQDIGRDEVIEVDERGVVRGAVTGPLREGPDTRPGFRVGDAAAPLPDRPFAEVQAEADLEARERSSL